MSTSANQTHTTTDAQDSIFGRVLVGIDDSPESVEAATQAAILATGPVTLLSAYDLTHTVVGGGMAPAPVVPLDEGGEDQPDIRDWTWPF